MAKKLLVRTPISSDGLSPQYDEDEKKVYKETILELSARQGLESINNSLPDSLRHKFIEAEVVDGKIVEQSKKDSLPTAAETVKLIQAAETVEEVEDLSNGDTRASVVKEAAKKIAELTAE